MKIMFVNACLGGDFSAMDIGITALATYLNERTQHSASICDLVFHRRHWKQRLARAIQTHNPDWIGISLNTLYLNYAKAVMAEVKKYNLPIIVGGHHASVHPEETISLPWVDVVCIGDGEYAVTEFLDRKEEGSSVEGIGGIWVKRNKGYTLKSSGGRFIQCIDDLPRPDWDLWEDLDRYLYFLGMVYLLFSRGCPHKCAFCDAIAIAQSVRGSFYRQQDPKRAAWEMCHNWNKYAYRGLRLAQVFDPVFTLSENWILDFCKEYRTLGAPLSFSAFSRIDDLNDRKVEALAEANCALLRVGIESGDEHIRNEVYQKRISDEKIRTVSALCKSHGINFTSFYILGGPGETKETVQRTIDMARELDAARTAFFIYKPFTKEAEKLLEEHGSWIDKERWAKADNITFGAAVGSPDLSPKKVQYYQVKAYFFTAGKRILRMIREDKLMYFWRLAAYMLKGMRYELSPWYLLTYYHIYSGKWVKK